MILSDLPALAEIVNDGVTGLLYPAGDVRSLADCILRLAEDDELRNTLGSNAKTWVEQERTWSIVATAGLAAYDTAMR